MQKSVLELGIQPVHTSSWEPVPNIFLVRWTRKSDTASQSHSQGNMCCHGENKQYCLFPILLFAVCVGSPLGRRGFSVLRFSCTGKSSAASFLSLPSPMVFQYSKPSQWLAWGMEPEDGGVGGWGESTAAFCLQQPKGTTSFPKQSALETSLGTHWIRIGRFLPDSHPASQ